MGEHSRPVATSNPLAQRYVDQGLVLSFAFNHAEAVRAFREAQRLDATCAMCAWGEALARGPHVNAPMNPEDVAPAWAALERTRACIEDRSVLTFNDGWRYGPLVSFLGPSRRWRSQGRVLHYVGT